MTQARWINEMDTAISGLQLRGVAPGLCLSAFRLIKPRVREEAMVAIGKGGLDQLLEVLR